MSDLPGIWGEMFAEAQKMARKLNPALESFSPESMERLWPSMPREVMETVWGDRLNPGGLDAKTRLLVVLAGLTAQGAQAEGPFRATVRQARAAGAGEKEIAEVIWQMSVLAGLPATGKAMQMAGEVFREDGFGEGGGTSGKGQDE